MVYIYLMQSTKVITNLMIDSIQESSPSIIDIANIQYFKNNFCLPLTQDQIETTEGNIAERHPHLNYFKKFNNVVLSETSYDRSIEINNFFKI